jgi:putative redox protein
MESRRPIEQRRIVMGNGDKEKNLREIVSRRIDFFTRKPDAAVYRPKASSRHVRGLYTETKVREHLVRSDYAEAAGGTNLAPNPIELLLSAIAACIEAAFYEFAVHQGFTVNALSVEVEGTLDLRGFFMIGDVPAGFRDLKYAFSIQSPDDEAKLRELAEKVIAHCPVVESLIRPTGLTGEIRITKGGRK